MTWRLVDSRHPIGGDAMPAQEGQPLACHLNQVVSVLVFDDGNGEAREVDFTWAMQRRAEDLEMTPEDFVSGLLRFADKAVA